MHFHRVGIFLIFLTRITASSWFGDDGGSHHRLLLYKGSETSGDDGFGVSDDEGLWSSARYFVPAMC